MGHAFDSSPRPRPGAAPSAAALGIPIAAAPATPPPRIRVRETLRRMIKKSSSELEWEQEGTSDDYALDRRAFPAEAASVRLARQFVRDLLTQWGLDDHADDAVLCVSELATNAVRHTGEHSAPFLVAATQQDDHVRIAVLDFSQRVPKPRIPTRDDASGRGLQVVAQLADRWGSQRSFLGKAVWFEFKIDSPTDGSDPC